MNQGIKGHQGDKGTRKKQQREGNRTGHPQNRGQNNEAAWKAPYAFFYEAREIRRKNFTFVVNKNPRTPKIFGRLPGATVRWINTLHAMEGHGASHERRGCYAKPFRSRLQ